MGKYLGLDYKDMQKFSFFLLIVACIAVILVGGCINSAENSAESDPIIGTWSNVGPDRSSDVTFNTDHSAVVHIKIESKNIDESLNGVWEVNGTDRYIVSVNNVAGINIFQLDPATNTFSPEGYPKVKFTKSNNPSSTQVSTTSPVAAGTSSGTTSDTKIVIVTQSGTLSQRTPLYASSLCKINVSEQGGNVRAVVFNDYSAANEYLIILSFYNGDTLVETENPTITVNGRQKAALVIGEPYHKQWTTYRIENVQWYQNHEYSDIDCKVTYM
jgi:hypothetical protein